MATVLCGCGRSNSAPTARQVRVAVSRDAVTYLPVHLAHTLGYYKEEGVDVTVAELSGLSKSMEAVLGGSADVTGGNTSPVQMAFEGRALQGFVMLYTVPPYALIVSPGASAKIRQIAGLKGHRVGITSPGSPTHHFLNYVLTQNGVPVKDVSAIGIGTGATSLAAIEHGQVEAAVLIGGAINVLERQFPGITFLADARTSDNARQIFGPQGLPGGVLVAQESWLKANPDTTRRFVRAVKKAMHWMGEHSPEQVRAEMREDQRMKDLDADLKTIREYQGILSQDGAFPAGMSEAVRKYLAVSIEKVRTANVDLSRAYTNEFLSGN